jgi:hypothetical protein
VLLLEDETALVTDQFALTALDELLRLTLGTACGLLFRLLLGLGSLLSLACRAFHYTFEEAVKVI